MIVYQEYSDDLIERKHACHKGVGTDESDFTQVPVPAVTALEKYRLRLCP